MKRRNRRMSVLGAVVVLGVVWLLLSFLNRSLVQPATSNSSSPSGTSSSSATIPNCQLSELPKQVAEAVKTVRTNGPYLRPRNDGGIFGNNEHLLPSRPNGYYKEYTVSDPTSSFPGPRRLVTGGQVGGGSEPTEWFYTADHYVHFCRVQGT
ncbi:MAG: ribonuclease domain-containing protein [Propionibacteriaceae bacterium]|nr:ribonuclease [Micropruina sp.]HBX82570.1 ribonuclease [Propionibacteriaceae bacterium]HBY24554.1 ribonuclease [Propionibacteriaceae bacterium]